MEGDRGEALVSTCSSTGREERQRQQILVGQGIFIFRLTKICCIPCPYELEQEMLLCSQTKELVPVLERLAEGCRVKKASRLR